MDDLEGLIYGIAEQTTDQSEDPEDPDYRFSEVMDAIEVELYLKFLSDPGYYQRCLDYTEGYSKRYLQVNVEVLADKLKAAGFSCRKTLTIPEPKVYCFDFAGSVFVESTGLRYFMPFSLTTNTATTFREFGRRIAIAIGILAAVTGQDRESLTQELLGHEHEHDRQSECRCGSGEHWQDCHLSVDCG